MHPIQLLLKYSGWTFYFKNNNLRFPSKSKNDVISEINNRIKTINYNGWLINYTDEWWIS